jgi:hypothetical protein
MTTKAKDVRKYSLCLYQTSANLGMNTCAKMLGEYAELIEKLAKGEAIAIVCDVFQIRWIGGDAISDIIKRNGIKVGDKLYTHPSPAQAEPAIIPDLIWSAADPENGDDPDEWISYNDYADGDVVDVLCANKLANAKIVVHVDSEGDLTWERDFATYSEVLK